MKYHYTYRITNIKDRMYYYGVHSCDCLPKEDIGVKYFSSSKKEFIKDQKENPQDYKYKVLKIFSTRKEAVEHEIFLHKKFNVKLHEQFYNRSNQTSTGFDVAGTTYSHTEEAKEKIRKYRKTYTHSEETKQKMSLSLSGRVLSEEHIEKLKIAVKNRPPATPETKQKMSIAKTGKNNPFYEKTHTEETKQKMSLDRSGAGNSMFGKKHSEETKQKMRKPKPQRYITCPYCGKNGGASNMKRYHFDNCKSKG